MTTYGEHAENAARALNTLLRTDAIPDDALAVDRLLHCREGVVDALRQRLYALGQDTWYPPVDHLPSRAPKPTLDRIDERLASLVDNIAFALPTLPFDERHSPVEVLSSAASDPTVEAWRAAAVELLAGSHALSAAGERPWEHDTSAGWYVIGDVAAALEAVVVLDARLQEVGLLAEHEHREFPMRLEEKRLVLSQAARVATWHATSDGADQATPRRARRDQRVVQPVSLVLGPEDLAAAQRHLGRLLRPLMANDSAFIGDPEISADSARQLTASQLYLCRAFAMAADHSPATRMFAAFFTERAEILAELQPRIGHLEDVKPHETDRRRFWQQSELTTAVARMLNRGTKLLLPPPQMLDLAKATHEVTHNLGKSLRLELLRGSSNLRDAHPRLGDGPSRVGRRSRIGNTVTDLVNLHAPREPIAQFSNPLQRAALKERLGLTPSASKTPTPFPAARSATYDPPRL